MFPFFSLLSDARRLGFIIACGLGVVFGSLMEDYWYGSHRVLEHMTPIARMTIAPVISDRFHDRPTELRMDETRRITSNKDDSSHASRYNYKGKQRNPISVVKGKSTGNRRSECSCVRARILAFTDPCTTSHGAGKLAHMFSNIWVPQILSLRVSTR